MALVVTLLVTLPATIAAVGGGVAVGVALGVTGARRRFEADGAGRGALEEAPAGGPDQVATNSWARDPRVERVLGALPLGVVVTDSAGEAVYRNRFAMQLEGGRHEEALIEASLEDVTALAIGGSAVERNLDIYGPPRRNLQLRVAPTHEDDELIGAVILVEDVSAAQHIDQVRRDFVANVSHELRTPIGAIGVLAETLHDATEPEVIERLSGRLQAEAFRLGDIIDDLLALSRLESGIMVEVERVDLSVVVEQAVQRTAGAAEQRSITIERTCSHGEPLSVEGDHVQIVAAVTNLLDNAIKYSDLQSTVTVDIGVDDGMAQITVADSGIGIPEADLDRVFERFYRVDAARSRVTGGTGLGLSIVRHVAVNHDGSISVSSEEGKGSAFTLRLPLPGFDSSPPASHI